MDWSTVAMLTSAMFIVMVLFICWLFYSLVMRIVRMFTRTTQKTLNVLSGASRRR